MPFCSSRNRKAIAADDAVRAIRQAKVNLRNKQREKEQKNGKPCPPVPRNATTVTTPQARCCNLMTDGSSNSMFFPGKGASGAKNQNRENLCSISANKQLPPSKSLSSPFPMQFRERQKNPPKPQLVVKTTQSTDSIKSSASSSDDNKPNEMETISSPLQAIRSISSSPKNAEQNNKLKSACKGDLPPPCPGSRRKVPVTTSSAKVRKSKRKIQQMKASKENARSTSVLDLDDDDEEDETDDDDDDNDDISIDDEIRIGGLGQSDLSVLNCDDREPLTFREVA
jgi:hypothetical protein